jgi:hypothetical protein
MVIVGFAVTIAILAGLGETPTIGAANASSGSISVLPLDPFLSEESIDLILCEQECVESISLEAFSATSDLAPVVDGCGLIDPPTLAFGGQVLDFIDLAIAVEKCGEPVHGDRSVVYEASDYLARSIDSAWKALRKA